MTTRRVRRMADWVHVWLGWIVGVQILLWTASGLFMVLWPIETVRGEHLKRAPPPLALAAIVPPRLAGELRPVRALALEQRLGRPVWVVRYVDGAGRIADARSGHFLKAIDARTALALARADYAGTAAALAVSRVDPAKPPVDYRGEQPAWRVDFADRTRLYVDADTGAVLSRRTRLWRAFDLMWGLHIMDWRGREDSSHPLLIAAAALSLASVAAGLALLPLARRRRARG